MLNRKFNNLPLLDQIKRLHQQIHRLNGVLNDGNFSANLTDKSVVFIDSSGNPTENENFDFDTATGDLSIPHDLIAGKGDLHSFTQYERGGDKFNHRSHDLGINVTETYERSGGSIASPTVIVPNNGANGTIKIDLFKLYDGTNYETAGTHQVLATKVNTGDVGIDWGWYNNLATGGDFTDTYKLFGISASTGHLSMPQFNKAVLTQTKALQTSETYVRASTIPFFSDSGSITEDEKFTWDSNTSILNLDGHLTFDGGSTKHFIGGDWENNKNVGGHVEYRWKNYAGTDEARTIVSANAIVHSRKHFIHDGVADVNAGFQQMKTGTVAAGNANIIFGWFDKTGNNYSSALTGRVFSISTELGVLSMDKYGAATPTQTTANTGGAYTTASTIPFFSDEGIITEDEKFTYEESTNSLTITDSGGSTIHRYGRSVFGEQRPLEVDHHNNLGVSAPQIRYTRAGGTAAVPTDAPNASVPLIYRWYFRKGGSTNLQAQSGFYSSDLANDEGFFTWHNGDSYSPTDATKVVARFWVKQRQVQFPAYVGTNTTATTLSKTPSPKLAQFSTDGTLITKDIATYASIATAQADGTLLVNELFKVADGAAFALYIKG